ncbi:chorismate mutase [Plastoroseomonas arctica]|uniref:chorismate mutase n=1 Tax=Plastoroseomonas arctica TaxID=1509237 RepID=A0AAF1K693_9PROT|nr:chorismate mutase [Plastoroseomonas arctica]MBR0657273.1 chorismate mutase [Plastoroseomonas arctica]
MPDLNPSAAPLLPTPPAYAAELATLRAEIDALDDALHDIVMRRAGIVARLAESRAKGAGPALRPGREAAILRRMLARHAGPLPRSALVRLWREIFAASTAMQSNFTVVAAADNEHADAVMRLTRAHFGGTTPIRAMTTVGQALAALLSGEAAIATLPAPEPEEREDAAWWVRFDANSLQVTARLPFLAEPGSHGVLVVSPTPPDPSGRDRTLLRIELTADFSHARLTRLLADAGIPAHSLQIRRTGEQALALAEVAGFWEADDPRLKSLAGLHVQRLGAYAEAEPG